MDSRPDALFLKVRIAFQIQPSGRQSAIVRMRVYMIWKLRIQLQPSGRLPIMVRMCATQIWKLRVQDQPSGQPSPWSRCARALYRNYLQWTCNRLVDNVSPSGRGSQTGKIFSINLENSGHSVVRPDDIRTYYCTRPLEPSTNK